MMKPVTSNNIEER